MSVFQKLAGVQAFENSKYFQEGTYVVEITKVKNIQGYKGESIVIETKVLGTDSPHENAPQPGEIAAQVWSVDGKKKEIGLSTWKGFLTVACELGPEADNMSDKEWLDLSIACTDGGALVGTPMYMQAWVKMIQSTGQPFTMHRWVRVATPEDLAQFGIE